MSVRTAIATLVVFLGAAPAFAQLGERIRIDNAQIGLPPGRNVGERDSGRASPVVKRNVWAPIYLELELKKEIRGGIRLRVDATDADNLKTTCSYPLLKNISDQQPGARLKAVEFGYIPYVRAGDFQGEVRLTIVSDDDDQKELSNPKLIETQQFRESSTYVVVSLGSRLPGFELPAEKNTSTTTNRGGLRNGRVETSAITNVREMPDQWFGYQAADLVVLTTGSATGDFLDDLFDKEKSRDFKPRRDALLEWVRRGGKLVITVGSNASKLVQSELFRDLLPATLSPNEPARSVDVVELNWRTTIPDKASLAPRAGKFPVARLMPNPTRPTQTLMADRSLTPDGPAFPLVTQAAFGLGRITVVAFDLDQSPFLELPKKAEVWDWLVRNAGSERASLVAPGQQTPTYNFSGFQNDTEDELATQLRTHVEYFDGVPVISFGWVALFIVLYTLLIGPVEYLFLKKILGRLELTWVTFPIIVLTVSAAAYFTAYAIKGKDLKVNKIDVVDVDLGSGRAYGHTYFTIFSPRIDSYTITVEPRAEWVVKPENEPTPPVLVDWMAGGKGGGSGGFLSRSYSYSGDQKDGGFKTGEGLIRVPIQVWSTKAFTASWSGYLDRDKPLIGALDLYHPQAAPETLAGSFTNNLPVKSLKDAVLFYAGTAYKLGTLTPGQTVDVVTGKVGDRAGTLSAIDNWFGTNAVIAQASNNNYGRGSRYNETTGPTNLSFWGALFHEKAVPAGTRLQNASLRHLDQSWRLNERNRDEAILVARVDASSGSNAEAVLTDKDGPSVTKLWLKGLPGDPKGREPVPGTIRQETYIRVYIPVGTTAKK